MFGEVGSNPSGSTKFKLAIKMAKKSLKAGWYVQHDGSPEFVEVINNLNKIQGIIPFAGDKEGWYYGVLSNGSPVASRSEKTFANCRKYELDKFLRDIGYNIELYRVRKLTSHITFSIFGKAIRLAILEDKKYGKRIYMQPFYLAPCTKTNSVEEWRGRKWYLTPHMLEDEVVKTAYAAFKAAVEHEIMEGFKYDGTVVFNPHTDFRKLMEVSPFEVKREPATNFDF
jgi:hypothetical protein